jgi:hypothetical protein
MGKTKKVARGQTPTEKETRSTKVNQHIIESSFQKNPVWQFIHLDMEHDEWGWKNLGENDHEEILQKLVNYESRKWGEIYKDKKRDHPVTVDHLSSKARKRLEELNLGDTEELYRLRFTGKMRIWGILHGEVFKILWLDPEHTVYPSQLKHT